MLDEIFCICLSGAGFAIGGHARWLGRAPGGGADPAGSLRGPGRGSGPPDRARSPGGAGPDHQHPAGDAGGRGGGLARLARRGRGRPGGAGRAFAGRVFGPGGRRGADAGPGRPPGAAAGCGHARGGAAGHGGDGGHPGASGPPVDHLPPPPSPVPLVRRRAAAMQEAVPLGTGAMAAILGLPAPRVIAGCAEASAAFGAGSTEVVEAVNFNDPVQTVIAGTQAGVAKACALLKAAGAKRALPLPVSAPFHCSLMQPAAHKLRAALAGITLASPAMAVVNNVDLAVRQDAAAIGQALYRQAFSPVRWVECVQALQARGATHIVECGPGQVLTGLTRRIAPELAGTALFDLATLAKTRELLA